MKYMTFTGNRFLPLGGVKDLSGTYENIAQAIAAIRKTTECDWYQIVEISTLKVVSIGTIRRFKDKEPILIPD